MLLRDVYTEIYGSNGKITKANLVDLAGTLSDIAGRDRPWTWRYLNGVIKGHKGFAVSGDLARALAILASKVDGQSELQARGREITVIVVNGIEPGSLVFGHSTRCPECQLLFVPNPGWRKYCPECRPPRGG